MFDVSYFTLAVDASIHILRLSFVQNAIENKMIVLFIQADSTSPKSTPPHHFIIDQVIIMQIKASSSKQNFDRSNVQLPGTVRVVFATSDCTFPVEMVCAGPTGLSVCNCQKLLHYFFGDFSSMSTLSSPLGNSRLRRSNADAGQTVTFLNINTTMSGGDDRVPAGADMKLQFHLLLTVDQFCHALIYFVEKLDELRQSA
jgi:hypothetical protein